MMRRPERTRFVWTVVTVVGLAIGFVFVGSASGAEEARALVLQEMAWPDVEQYLKQSDMVIIPIGSTEQHGPHLPLGTDFIEAFEISKRISAATGVVVAPVVVAGYSVYHSGFPGTLSLKPETLAEVLFETSEILQKYGFRRFLFFNFHGGNRVAEALVIQRINHTTKAIAVSIGIGAPFFHEGVGDPHAGIDETSLMLRLRPDLVKLARAEKPVLHFSPEVEELLQLSKEHPELTVLANALLPVPVETGKGGSMREISNNGIWSDNDPKTATAALGEKIISETVSKVTAFVEAWKKAERR